MEKTDNLPTFKFRTSIKRNDKRVKMQPQE